MRAGRTHQPLSYAIRLPDEAQADALRLLDASRAVGVVSSMLNEKSRAEYDAQTRADYVRLREEYGARTRGKKRRQRETAT